MRRVDHPLPPAGNRFGPTNDSRDKFSLGLTWAASEPDERHGAAGESPGKAPPSHRDFFFSFVLSGPVGHGTSLAAAHIRSSAPQVQLPWQLQHSQKKPFLFSSQIPEFSVTRFSTYRITHLIILPTCVIVDFS